MTGGSVHHGRPGTESHLELLSGYRFRFPTLQPGAFLLLGLLVAGVNALTGTLNARNTRESR